MQKMWKGYRKRQFYSNFQKYVPIDLANFSKVIASEAKQSDAKHRPERSRGICVFMIRSFNKFRMILHGATDCFVVTPRRDSSQ